MKPRNTVILRGDDLYHRGKSAVKVCKPGTSIAIHAAEIYGEMAHSNIRLNIPSQQKLTQAYYPGAVVRLKQCRPSATKRAAAGAAETLKIDLPSGRRTGMKAGTERLVQKRAFRPRGCCVGWG